MNPSFDHARRFFDQAADILNLSQNMRTLLLTPQREIKVLARSLIVRLSGKREFLVRNAKGVADQKCPSRARWKGTGRARVVELTQMSRELKSLQSVAQLPHACASGA